jgi:hypothetical protein
MPLKNKTYYFQYYPKFEESVMSCPDDYQLNPYLIVMSNFIFDLGRYPSPNPERAMPSQRAVCPRD